MICRLLVGALAVCLAACRTADTPVADERLVERFQPPLEVGRTTRADALLRFGMPAERFEDDRILCWRIAVSAATARPVSVYVSPFYAAMHSQAFATADVDPRVRVEPQHLASLVLVFDGGGVLQRKVALRQP